MTIASEGAIAIRSIPLFAGCSDATVDRLASYLQTVRCVPGQVLFSEGDSSRDLYVVVEGELRVVSDVADERVVYAHLSPGEFVGEMALITGEPRSAGVIATTEAVLWRLTREDFDRVQQQHEEISQTISAVLAGRLRHGNLHRYENEPFTMLALTPERSTLTIGRHDENDLVINDPQVDGLHARLENSGGRWRIFDESASGTTFVNRQRVKSAELSDGDEILIGTNKVYLDGMCLRGFQGHGGVRIAATGLSKTLPNGQVILDGVSICIQPGEFVAVVGSSGAGKTTLLHALNGFSPANEGAVTYNGVDLYSNLALFRSVLGYVPQDDIVHAELTVGRTLFYGAKLRLPRDTSDAEITQRIDDVLESVELADRRDVEVRRLSGGQRKRVSVAIELLSRPRALYLDEPTSGLDPALEGRMMSLLRDLGDQGATVVVTTHATQNLRMCDRVVWLAPGGKLVFFGSPAEALRHFGVQEFGEIYEKLDSPEACQAWAERFVDSAAHRVNVVERLHAAESPAATPQKEPAAEIARPGSLHQFFWLARRYAEILVRDRTNLALTFAQAPLIGLATLILFSPDIFALTLEEGGDAFRALMALHVITASSIFLGAANAAREITKESAVYRRERLVNLDIVPYVMSKFVVLAIICALQAPMLLGVFVARIDLPGSIFWQMLAAIYITELAGVSMGLLISAVSTNSDRALALVPILFIPQLIFAGAIVPFGRMLLPAQALAQLMISKWALQLTGSLTELSERFPLQFPEAYAGPYGDQLDDAQWISWAVLAAFCLGMLAATIVVQRLKDIR